MGAKYTTQTISGYNSSPPPDDGSQVGANLITWAAQKTKLADPIKTLAEAENTALVSAFDYSVRQITASDNTVASDHMRCVEIAPTATTGVTVSLGDAATMTNVYRVYIKNSSPHQQTIGRVTGADTIDGTAANVSIPSKSTFELQTISAATGYLLTGVYPLEITNLTEDAAPAVSDLVPSYDLSATSLKKIQLFNFFKVINGLTEDAAPAESDLVATYDLSATAAKSVQLRRIISALTGYKVGSFTRDTSLGSGTQAVTGVGFKPRAILYFAALTGATPWSVGFDDAATAFAVHGRENVAAGTMGVDTFSISIIQGASNTYQGVTSTFDSDGFTISWTKSGTTSGTYTIGYLALR